MLITATHGNDSGLCFFRSFITYYTLTHCILVINHEKGLGMLKVEMLPNFFDQKNEDAHPSNTNGLEVNQVKP